MSSYIMLGLVMSR